MTTTREQGSPLSRRIVGSVSAIRSCGANVLALAGGKMIGLTLVLTAMAIYLPPALHAQAAPAGPSPEINAINTMWVLIAAFLVFCMQVGFVMLEAGFARSRESVNILVEGIVDTASAASRSGPGALRSCSNQGMALSARPVSFSTAFPRPTVRPACHSSPSGCSSSRSRIPARRSPLARWSAAADSSATSSTASA